SSRRPRLPAHRRERAGGAGGVRIENVPKPLPRPLPEAGRGEKPDFLPSPLRGGAGGGVLKWPLSVRGTRRNLILRGAIGPRDMQSYRRSSSSSTGSTAWPGRTRRTASRPAERPPAGERQGYTCPVTGEELPCPKCCPLNQQK